MKEKVLRVGIAFFIILAMLLGNFIQVGMGLVSYAAETSIQSATNSSNVQFSVYFKDDNGNKVDVKENPITSKTAKLYMEINVKNQGYLNGEINLENSNFNIISSNSEYVNKVENNKITLNQMNAGTEAQIEFDIELKTSETLDLSLLNMESDIKLSGIYKDSTQRDISINTDRKIKLSLVNANNTKENVTNSTEVITNGIFKVKGEDKRVVQVLVKQGLNENTYPIKQITTKISAPVLDKSTPEIQKYVMRNSMTSYTDSYENGNVTIDMKNDQNENKVIWKNNGNEQIVLTYIYDKNVNIDNMKITTSEIVTLYDNTQIEAANTETKVNSQDTKNSTVTANITSSETEMFKGNLNAGLNRTVKTIQTVNVNMTNIVDYIELSEQGDTFLSDDKELGANVEYNQTVINKNQLLSVLGEQGTLTILNQNDELLATINKDNGTDENGNVIINYTENLPTALKMKTSAPVNVGKIDITNTKVIKQTDSKIVSSANGFANPLYLKTNIMEQAEKVGSANITLKESTTQAKLEVNRTSLSTIAENKGVEIKATINSNSEQYDLYKNPEIKITLPEDVIDAKVNSIDMLYGEEYQFNAGMTTENNRKVITIKLTGEQTSYKELGIDGTTIIIKADLKLNNKATNKKASIDMAYSNENAKQYKDGQAIGSETSQIEIVSPKGLITTNNSSTLGIETIGEENIKTNTVAKGAEEKEVSFESEIINNNENGIKDLKVIGNYGTDGKLGDKTNNLGLVAKSGLNVEATDISKVKVYYTENANATEDLNNQENGWTDTIKNPSKVQKYLLTVDEMAIGDSVKTNYTATLPENLEYNKQAYQGYTASYTDSVLGTQGSVKATDIALETGVGPVAEVTLGATVGSRSLASGDIVKQGEIIKYQATVKNTGSMDLKDFELIGNVPEGTVLIEQKEEYTGIPDVNQINENYNYNSYIEKDDNTKIIKIDSLPVGQSTIIEYEVKVKEDTTEGTKIENSTKIRYGEVTKESNIFMNIVKKSILIVNTKSLMSEGVVMGNGETAEFITTVKNISSDVQKNLNVSWVLQEGVEVTYQKSFNIDNIENIIKESNDKNIVIDSINPGETIAVQAVIKFNNITSESTNISALVKIDGEEYTSNENEVPTKENFKYDFSLSANNEKEYIKTGDKVTYVATITNTNEKKYEGAIFSDEISDKLAIQKITVNGEEIDISGITSNKIVISNLNFEANETKTINMETVVNYQEGRNEDIEISNQAKFYANSEEQESNIVKHIIAAETLLPDGTIVYKANGYAWLDENQNGIKDESEKAMTGIPVKLLNASTNAIQKNYKGEEIVATTDDSGYYTLPLIPEGNYLIVFEYDSAQYLLTTYKAEGADESVNSDAVSRELNITGTPKTYGVTDNIDLTKGNVSNVNIGLIKAQKFDMKLDKYVSKITVQSSKGTKTHTYDNETLAKLELDAKEISNANVIIEYSIVVTNVGEVPGYIKNIVDYMPSDLKFNSELNKDWYQSNGIVYTNTLENEKIASGEQKTVKLIVTKTMTENNTGLINNTAEIAEDYNEYGISDTNSTPGNKAKGENDMGSADVIVSIRTGGPIVYIALTISIVAIAGVSIYLIRREVFRGNI